MSRILLTGASGQVASLLRPRLRRADRHLRLLDIAAPADAPTAEEEYMHGSVADLDAMVEACQGVDAVIHLGGQSREAGAEEVLRLNAYGTWCVLEAARRAGVRRVVLASSNHAAGFADDTDLPPGGLPADTPGRPDTLYGWSKVAAEAVGRLYADRYQMDVLCLRIGLWFPKPVLRRGLALWLSPDDGARLIEACLATPSPGYRILWGISRNTRRWCSLAEGEAIGYHPVDDAEIFAAELATGPEPEVNRIGGQWCEIPLGKAY